MYLLYIMVQPDQEFKPFHMLYFLCQKRAQIKIGSKFDTHQPKRVLFPLGHNKTSPAVQSQKIGVEVLSF